MSFILDALKKSESERQRQTGPALFEVRRAPPRNRFPLWAVIIGVLLVINLGVVVWLLVGSSSKRAAANQTAAATAPAAVTPTPQPAAPLPPPAAGNSNMPYVDPRSASARNVPPDEEADYREPAPRDDVREEGMLNPDDYEPAREPANPPARAAANQQEEPARRPRNTSGLPSYQDVLAMPGMNVPPLRLDLHVYDPKPDASFVFLNMQKLKQGETLAQGGVQVDRITPEGAVLSFRGVQFVLPRE
jgi:general secretion pathway protein B